MITQRFLWSKKGTLVKHSQGLRGTGWTLLWLHWLALRKTCPVGCGDDISRVIADFTTGFIFQERQTFHWDATLSVEKNMSFPGVTHKKTSSSTHVAKTLCPLHFPVCAKYHIFTFAELLQNICRHQGFCQDGAFEIFCLENGARKVSTFQIRLNW